jgi:Tol biopolymer transport system component
MRARVTIGAIAAILSATGALTVAATATGATNGRIAFQALVGGFPQLFTIAPDGTGLGQITRVPRHEPGAENPAWSPDGSRIAFDTKSGKGVNLFTVRPDGTAVTELRLAVGAFNRNPAYSPDGTRISFDRAIGSRKPKRHGIFVANADGSGARRLTTAPRNKVSYDTQSQWSPDGTRIAFTRVSREGEAAVFVIGVDGTGLKRLTPYKLDAASPDWSPDGRKILFNSHFDPRRGQSANVYWMRPRGGHRTALTRHHGGRRHSVRPSWSPDGTRIVFARFTRGRNGGRIDLYTMNRSGTDLERLTRMSRRFPTNADWGERNRVPDAGAFALPAQRPPPPAQCSDGLDSEGDGLTDFPADPGCLSPTDTDETSLAEPRATADPVVVIAGDIAGGDSGTRDEATADVIAQVNPDRVLTAGDNAYPDGTLNDFLTQYDPSWGRFKSKTSPSTGNHEYHTANAQGYADYFGAAGGPAGRYYYSQDIGNWHLIALNSNISRAVGSEQEQWLRQDLASVPLSKCVLAYWHYPLYTSDSEHGPSTSVRALQQALYDARADVVVNGHNHNYERFALQDANGNATSEGIRNFVVGTGGAGQDSSGAPSANSQARASRQWGVLKVTLHRDSYDFEFRPAAGSTFTDSGATRCHNPSPPSG